MRFSLLAPLAGLSLFAALLSPTPAAAQVPPTAENAITCATIYRYLGDTGPAYEQLAAKNAALTGRSIADVKAELDQREPRLRAGVADGRLKASDMDSLGAGACPQTFGVAPAKRGASMAASGTPADLPDPRQCAGLFRWLDAKYPVNAWGSTWAGDEMVRRAASRLGMSYDALERQMGNYAPTTDAPAVLLDLAVRCQNAYDTPVPPGAVVAAAQHGDRPGIDRGRNHYCQALSNDFDSNFPDVASVEQAILRNPPWGMEQTTKTLEKLQYSFKKMEEAQCPASFAQPRFDAFQNLTSRAAAAIQQAKARLEREGKWW